MDTTGTLAPTTRVAARAEDAVKIYGTGDAEVRALDGISVEFPHGAIHRDHGPVGLREVHAAALHGRASTG